MKTYGYIVALLLVIGLLATSCGYSGHQAFQDALANPLPRSVVIVKGEGRAGWERQAWLHFTISPSDLLAILATGYQLETAAGAGMDHVLRQHPAWWDPKRLGGHMVYSKWFDKGKGDYWCRTLFVNAQTNEVFCWVGDIVR